MEQANKIKAFFVAVGTVINVVFGWCGWLAIALAVLMATDYVLGSMNAGKNGAWSSTESRKGIRKKVAYILVCVAAGVLDLVIRLVLANVPGVTLPFAYSVAFLPMVMLWYILTELGSILENADALGAKIPAFLKSAMQVFQAQFPKDMPPSGEPPTAENTKNKPDSQG